MPESSEQRCANVTLCRIVIRGLTMILNALKDWEAKQGG